MADGGLIVLPRTHPVLEETVRHQLELAQEVKTQDPNLDSKEKKKLGSVSLTFYDFEHSHYKVTLVPKSSTVMTVSLNLPCFPEIEKEGVEEMLKKKYGDMLQPTEQGYHVTLGVDVMEPGQPIDSIVKLFAGLKESILITPMVGYFQAFLDGKPREKTFSFNLRKDTVLYIVPRKDRVTTALRLSLQDPVDLQVAEIFLKDYKEVQRRKAGGAPPAWFSINPPEELEGEKKGSLGFISFAVQERHMKDMAKTAAAIINFRSFLQYHLKCSKAFFHSRMRKKVKEFLKVLNRAKTDFEGETKKKTKKTAGGKVFKAR